jgi:hypothetical protein
MIRWIPNGAKEFIRTKFGLFRNSARNQESPLVSANEADFVDLLRNKFTVTRFADNFFVTPNYSIALCEKPK